MILEKILKKIPDENDKLEFKRLFMKYYGHKDIKNLPSISKIYYRFDQRPYIRHIIKNHLIDHVLELIDCKDKRKEFEKQFWIVNKNTKPLHMVFNLQLYVWILGCHIDWVYDFWQGSEKLF